MATTDNFSAEYVFFIHNSSNHKLISQFIKNTGFISPVLKLDYNKSDLYFTQVEIIHIKSVITEICNRLSDHIKAQKFSFTDRAVNHSVRDILRKISSSMTTATRTKYVEGEYIDVPGNEVIFRPHSSTDTSVSSKGFKKPISDGEYELLEAFVCDWYLMKNDENDLLVQLFKYVFSVDIPALVQKYYYLLEA